MGAAARMAARHGKDHCDNCRKPFSDERRIASFCDDPVEAICQWCDLKRECDRSQMSRETLVYRPSDPRADEFGFIPKRQAVPLARPDPAPMVMSDIIPYRAVAVDHTGKRPIIGGRRQHREFLRDNGYVELGNDYAPPRREELSRPERIADIKRALGE